MIVLTEQDYRDEKPGSLKRNVAWKTFKGFRSAVDCFYVDRACDLVLHIAIYALPCSCVYDPVTKWYKLHIADNCPCLPLQLCQANYVFLTHEATDGFVWPKIAYQKGNRQDTTVALIKDKTAAHLSFASDMCLADFAYQTLDGFYTLGYKTLHQIQSVKSRLQVIESQLIETYSAQRE